MNTENSMRSIDTVIRDLVLHTQELEKENRDLKERIRNQSYKLARATEYAQEMDVKNVRLCHRMQSAAKYTKAALNDDDGLSNKAIRLLWKSLDCLNT